MNTILAPGARVAERYELLRQVGEGGMGSVWVARHLALDAPVAIKFVHMQGGEPERFQMRFQREAQLAASVRHRNVVSITDYGVLNDGTAFMVMDYLEGESLASFLRVRPPAAEMVYLVELTTRGLVAVHDAGIVHRDLKPENIFLVRDATGVYPKLIDFGISKHLRPEGERRSAVTTTDGAIVGTPAYMSPEQARGLLDLDQRTDIYSMGVILYEGLSGRLPYDSPYVGDLILAIVMGGAKSLHELRPDLDSRLSDVVMRAMAPDATKRYQTARDLLYALSKVAPMVQDFARSDRPPSNIRISPIAPPQRLPPPEPGTEPLPAARPVVALGADSLASAAGLHRSPIVSRRTWLAAGAILLGLALLLGGVWLGVQRTRSAPAARVKPAPAATQAPPSGRPRPVESLTVELTGLPDGGVLMLDGRPASGTRFQLEKDGTPHVLSATADGFAPWSQTFTADADHRIEVKLVPSAPVLPPPVENAQPEPVRPRPAHTTKPKAESPRPKVMTELDY
jgi:serine/threonine-protein kinase